jgi:hypothetical protein
MFGGVTEPMQLEMLGTESFPDGTTLLRYRPLAVPPAQ